MVGKGQRGPGVARTAGELAIFPVAPVAVIYAVLFLCLPIWREMTYGGGRDTGHAIVGFHMVGAPGLLLLIALYLMVLTLVSRWVLPAMRPGILPWVRGLFLILRVVPAAGAAFLFLAACAFFMGDATAVFTQWPVAASWLLTLSAAGAFIWQQWRRLRETWALPGPVTPLAADAAQASGASADASSPELSPDDTERTDAMIRALMSLIVFPVAFAALVLVTALTLQSLEIAALARHQRTGQAVIAGVVILVPLHLMPLFLGLVFLTGVGRAVPGLVHGYPVFGAWVRALLVLLRAGLVLGVLYLQLSVTLSFLFWEPAFLPYARFWVVWGLTLALVGWFVADQWRCARVLWPARAAQAAAPP